MYDFNKDQIHTVIKPNKIYFKVKGIIKLYKESVYNWTEI